MTLTQPYEPLQHDRMILSWVRARGAKDPHRFLQVLPPTGAVVENVAAGFAYLTNGPVVYLDGFITNPEAPANMRDIALDHIVKDLLAGLCKDALVVSANSCIPEIVARSKKHGFRVLEGFSTFVREVE